YIDRFTSANDAFTTLHTFSGQDGTAPWGDLVRGSDGAIYGTSEGGRLASGGVADGTVFKMTTDGATFATLKTLNGVSGSGADPFGSDPSQRWRSLRRGIVDERK